MKKLQIAGKALLVALLLVCGCRVNKTPETEMFKGEELVFSGEAEPVNGKLDVYQSMTRAVKYNVDAASHSLSKKIYNQNPNLRPDDIIRNVLNSNINDTNQLYNMSRVLEFAVIYAVSNLETDREYIENYFYNKSSQHLALAAIRSHQDAWWADRKGREIDRLSRPVERKIKDLAQKQERAGYLSKEDVYYKKNLEVALLKMSELQKALAFNKMEYGQLVKAGPKEINPEGRRFYQLEDFDQKYSLEIFQEAAVRNRNEFAKAKEQVQNYSFEEVRGNVIRKYPLIERLDINGLDIEDSVYYKEMQNRVMTIARNLVDAVMKYRLAKPADRNQARKLAYDELGAAIMAQVEVNFKLVQLADTDYENIQKEITTLKAKIKQAERIRQPSVDDKLAVLNNEISLMEMERKAAQIMAERAVALRGLYFNAGLSPFSRTLLRAPVTDIAQTLKKAFNKDLVEMLAAASVPVKTANVAEANEWAKGSNWLEALMKEPQTTQTKQVASVNQRDYDAQDTRFTPYGPEAAKFKTMQLGAYEQKQNAFADWDQLVKRFEGLKSYNPGLERQKDGGRILFKLVVHDSRGGLQEICNQLRSAQTECLLK